jgi:alpha-tubulin suppressor-like RCC1 family protein
MPSLGKRHLSLLPVTLALATGVFAAPAQAAGGTALGWGLNDYGQTGIGSVSTTGCKCVVTPSPVAGISEVTEISAGSRFALALLSDGTVRSWGNNSYGELAHGESNSSVPVTVNGLPGGVVAIAAGALTGYALLANGTVMAWGGNEAGQLGQGESTGPHACEKGSPCSRTPVLVQGLSNVIAIASGGRYLLALRADGTVMIWGSDTYGQLGDGDTQPGCICVDHPVPVPGLSGIVGVGGGYYEAGAAAEDGTGRAWGYNGTGIAGNGTTEGVLLGPQRRRAARGRVYDPLWMQLHPHAVPGARADRGDGDLGHRQLQPRAPRRRHGPGLGCQLKW